MYNDKIKSSFVSPEMLKAGAESCLQYDAINNYSSCFEKKKQEL